MNDDIEFFIETQPNVGFSELVWDVFFKSRERGISLKKHVPFLLNSSDNIYYILCKKAGRVIGGLVLQRCVHSEIGAYGVIGLVCVASECRGRGIAKLLLDRAIKLAKEIDFSACTLWTRFPAVYVGHGFEMVGKAFSGAIDFSDKELSFNQKFEQFDLPVIPSFSISGCKVVVDASSFSYVDNGSIRTLVDWTGDVDVVLSAVRNLMPRRINFLLSSDDCLIKKIDGEYGIVTLDGEANQMWLVFDSSLNANTINEKIWIGLLDRI